MSSVAYLHLHDCTPNLHSKYPSYDHITVRNLGVGGNKFDPDSLIKLSKCTQLNLMYAFSFTVCCAQHFDEQMLFASRLL